MSLWCLFFSFFAAFLVSLDKYIPSCLILWLLFTCFALCVLTVNALSEILTKIPLEFKLNSLGLHRTFYSMKSEDIMKSFGILNKEFILNTHRKEFKMNSGLASFSFFFFFFSFFLISFIIIFDFMEGSNSFGIPGINTFRIHEWIYFEFPWKGIPNEFRFRNSFE